MKGNFLTYIFLGILFLTVSSCRPEVDGVRVLSKDKFADVLTDVYVTDAMFSTLDVKSKSRWQRGMKALVFQDAAYQWILAKYDITDAEFYASVKYYTVRPNLIGGIFDDVEQNLILMQKDVEHRKALREAEEERLAYERKWKIVHIDSAYIAQWGVILSMDSLSLESADSVLTMLKKLGDICPDETTPAYWDSIHKVEAFIKDSLRIDSIRLDSIRLDSLRIDSLRIDSLRLDSLRIDSIGIDTLQIADSI